MRSLARSRSRSLTRGHGSARVGSVDPPAGQPAISRAAWALSSPRGALAPSRCSPSARALGSPRAERRGPGGRSQDGGGGRRPRGSFPPLTSPPPSRALLGRRGAWLPRGRRAHVRPRRPRPFSLLATPTQCRERPGRATRPLPPPPVRVRRGGVGNTGSPDLESPSSSPSPGWSRGAWLEVQARAEAALTFARACSGALGLGTGPPRLAGARTGRTGFSRGASPASRFRTCKSICAPARRVALCWGVCGWASPGVSKGEVPPHSLFICNALDVHFCFNRDLLSM